VDGALSVLRHSGAFAVALGAGTVVADTSNKLRLRETREEWLCICGFVVTLGGLGCWSCAVVLMWVR
jgi:hypothetical protein